MSAKPRRIADYHLDLHAADLQAIIDDVDDGAGAVVHLVGHDRGSVQGWQLITSMLICVDRTDDTSITLDLRSPGCFRSSHGVRASS